MHFKHEMIEKHWNFELTMFKLTMHLKNEMIGKHVTETSNKVEL